LFFLLFYSTCHTCIHYYDFGLIYCLLILNDKFYIQKDLPCMGLWERIKYPIISYIDSSEINVQWFYKIVEVITNCTVWEISCHCCELEDNNLWTRLLSTLSLVYSSVEPMQSVISNFVCLCVTSVAYISGTYIMS